MRNFIRYLLALSVLTMGFYGASQHRLSDEQAHSPQTLALEQLIPTATPDPAPQIPATARQVPMAALIDTDRTLAVEPTVDPRATLKTLPEIARRESVDSPSVSSQVGNRDEVIPAKKRAKSKPIAHSPTPHVERTVPDASPQIPANRDKGEAESRAASAQDFADRRPADEPRSLASWASMNADSRLPMPKLDPRPGNRFTLPDPPEPNSSAPVSDEISPWDWLGEADDRTDEHAADLAENDTRNAPKVAEAEATETEGAETQVAEPAATVYSIEEGDTLPKLAERYLGSREQYEAIYRANADILGDPRLLPIGLQIKIPAQSVASAPANRGSAKTPVPEPLDALHDELFGKPAEPEDSGSDLIPIPPQALPPHQYGAWQYSVR
ncbi:MAG: tail protein X [Pirellulaceae bacterium]|nr:tail protein X [Pirellulaceae bacterium]